jgi:beta-glucanase (GH16 family)
MRSTFIVAAVLLAVASTTSADCGGFCITDHECRRKSPSCPHCTKGAKGLKKLYGQCKPSIPPSTPAHSFCDQPGWAVEWSDEFDGNALDNASWTVREGHYAPTTRWATGLADNVYVANGSLVLRSERQTSGKYNYTTGAVNSKQKRFWKGPARACIRAKLPGSGPSNNSGLGIWPAHWMMPEDHDGSPCWPAGGEIDIMEMFNGAGHVDGTYHWAPASANCTTKHMCKCDGKEQLGFVEMPADWGTAWHEFAVEYSTTGMKFAVDGAVYQSLPNKNQIPFKHPEFYDLAYHMILNTAVGTLSQMPTAETVFPTYHLIDYVRVAKPKP